MNVKKEITKTIAAMAGCILLVIVIIALIPKRSENSAETPADKAEAESMVYAEETEPAETKGPLETLDWDEVLAAQESTSAVLEQYQALKEEIPDLIGWIRIEDTGIDYPVVRKNNDFYVTHDVYGQDDVYGAIFLDQVNDVEKPDNNLIIYGHHRKDAKMFGELMQYKSEDYYKAHPYIEFDTLYARGRYEIISVFLSKVYYTTDTDFKYYQFFGSDDPEEFQDYVDNVKALSLYETEADASFGDELITLSTCEYSVENGRLAIVARKIADVEE